MDMPCIKRIKMSSPKTVKKVISQDGYKRHLMKLVYIKTALTIPGRWKPRVVHNRAVITESMQNHDLDNFDLREGR